MSLQLPEGQDYDSLNGPEDIFALPVALENHENPDYFPFRQEHFFPPAPRGKVSTKLQTPKRQPIANPGMLDNVHTLRKIIIRNLGVLRWAVCHEIPTLLSDIGFEDTVTCWSCQKKGKLDGEDELKRNPYKAVAPASISPPNGVDELKHAVKILNGMVKMSVKTRHTLFYLRSHQFNAKSRIRLHSPPRFPKRSSFTKPAPVSPLAAKIMAQDHKANLAKKQHAATPMAPVDTAADLDELFGIINDVGKNLGDVEHFPTQEIQDLFDFLDGEVALATMSSPRSRRSSGDDSAFSETFSDNTTAGSSSFAANDTTQVCDVIIPPESIQEMPITSVADPLPASPNVNVAEVVKDVLNASVEDIASHSDSPKMIVLPDKISVQTIAQPGLDFDDEIQIIGEVNRSNGSSPSSPVGRTFMRSPRPKSQHSHLPNPSLLNLEKECFDEILVAVKKVAESRHMDFNTLISSDTINEITKTLPISEEQLKIVIQGNALNILKESILPITVMFARQRHELTIAHSTVKQEIKMTPVRNRNSHSKSHKVIVLSSDSEDEKPEQPARLITRSSTVPVLNLTRALPESYQESSSTSQESISSCEDRKDLDYRPPTVSSSGRKRIATSESDVDEKEEIPVDRHRSKRPVLRPKSQAGSSNGKGKR